MKDEIIIDNEPVPNREIATDLKNFSLESKSAFGCNRTEKVVKNFFCNRDPALDLSNSSGMKLIRNIIAPKSSLKNKFAELALRFR